MNLKTRIFLSIFLSSFLIIIVVGTGFLFGYQKSTYGLLEEYNKTSSRFAQRMVYAFYNDDSKIDEEELAELKYEFSQVQFGHEGYSYIIDLEGNLVIHPTAEGENISDRPHIQEMIEKKEGSIRYEQTTPPSFGRIKQVYYRYIPELGWIVVTGPYIDEFQALINKAIIHFIGIICVVFILDLIVAISLTKKIYYPIRKGTQEISNIIHRIDSESLKSQIHKQVNKITGYDAAIDKTLNSIKKVTPKKHS